MAGASHAAVDGDDFEEVGLDHVVAPARCALLENGEVPTLSTLIMGCLLRLLFFPQLVSK